MEAQCIFREDPHDKRIKRCIRTGCDNIVKTDFPPEKCHARCKANDPRPIRHVKKTRKPSPKCIHLGQTTGKSVDCGGCGGRKAVFHCALYGECVPNTNTDLKEYQVCTRCPDFKVSDDPPKKPSIAKRAANFAKAGYQHIKEGRPKRSGQDLIEVLQICQSNKCGQLVDDGKVCAECGCYVALKAQWEDQHCPLNYW